MIIETKKKTVSIVMATFNGELFLKEQLESILYQTYPVFELIIQDDASTDKTSEILNEFKNRYPNLIRCYINKKQIGHRKNFINAFKLAQGDYIAPSDQDDIWEKSKIEELVNIIGENSLAYCQDIVLYENGQIIEEIQDINPLERLLYSNNLKGHTLIFKRELLQIFDLNNVLSYDHMLALYVKINKSYVFTTKPLCVWRRHNDTLTKVASVNSSININKINKYRKCFLAMLMLIKKKNKSSAVELNGYHKYEYINKISLNERDKLAARLMLNISEQTLLSYFFAAIQSVRLIKYNEQYSNFSLREKIAKLIFEFCYPFCWWFDIRKEKFL